MICFVDKIITLAIINTQSAERLRETPSYDGVSIFIVISFVLIFLLKKETSFLEEHTYLEKVA